MDLTLLSLSVKVFEFKFSIPLFFFLVVSKGEGGEDYFLVLIRTFPHRGSPCHFPHTSNFQSH